MPKPSEATVLSIRCINTTTPAPAWLRSGALLAALAVSLVTLGCASQAPPPRAESTTPETTSASIDPATQDAFEQALSLLQRHEYEQAIALLSPISSAHPELPGPLVNLAIAYIHLDRQDQAVRTLQKALASDANHPVALNWLAILERREGRFEQARSLYERLLAAHPESRNGHLNLGILCDLYLQQMDCALNHYRRYQELAANQDSAVSHWIADLERRQQQGRR